MKIYLIPKLKWGMVNMNMLSDSFNDDVKIFSFNKKYLCHVVLLSVILLMLLFIKKNMYYQNSFNIVNEKIMLLVDNKYINVIKETKEIEIEGIRCSFSINSILPLEDKYYIDISLNPKIDIISNGIYKIYLGKERLFEYIVRIINK